MDGAVSTVTTWPTFVEPTCPTHTNDPKLMIFSYIKKPNLYCFMGKQSLNLYYIMTKLDIAHL